MLEKGLRQTKQVVCVQNRGKRNLAALYAYMATSRLWFDGALWMIFWQQRGVNIFQVGLLEGLLHVVAVLSDVPLGAFADRFGRRVALALSAICGVGYCSLAIVTHGFFVAALAFMLRGLQVTLASGSDSALTYESAVQAGLQARYLTISGRMFAIALVSLGIAEMAGGILATWSWSAVYVAFLCANVASLVAVLWIRPARASRGSEPGIDAFEPVAQAADSDAGFSEDAVQRPASALAITVSAITFARQSSVFVRWIVLSAVLSGFIATFAFYGQALLRHDGFTLAAIGILSGVENGLGAVASVAAGRVVARFGEQATMSAVGLFTSLGLILFAFVPGLGSGAGFLMNSVAGNLAEPVIDQGLNREVPSSQRATLLSFNSTAFSLFMIGLFPVFGFVANRAGVLEAAEASSLFGALCVLMSVVWWRFGMRNAELRADEGV